MKKQLNWKQLFEKYKRFEGVSIETPRKTANGLNTFFIYSDTFDATLEIQGYLTQFNVDTNLNKVNYKDLQVIFE